PHQRDGRRPAIDCDHNVGYSHSRDVVGQRHHAGGHERGRELERFGRHAGDVAGNVLREGGTGGDHRRERQLHAHADLQLLDSAEETNLAALVECHPERSEGAGWAGGTNLQNRTAPHTPIPRYARNDTCATIEATCLTKPSSSRRVTAFCWS